MAVMPKYYKIHTDGCDVALEPIYTELVPVVRCKDCKHYNIYRLECHNGNMNGIIGIDGFCSYGERKDGEA